MNRENCRAHKEKDGRIKTDMVWPHTHVPNVLQRNTKEVRFITKQPSNHPTNQPNTYEYSIAFWACYMEFTLQIKLLLSLTQKKIFQRERYRYLSTCLLPIQSRIFMLQIYTRLL